MTWGSISQLLKPSKKTPAKPTDTTAASPTMSDFVEIQAPQEPPPEVPEVQVFTSKVHNLELQTPTLSVPTRRSSMSFNVATDQGGSTNDEKPASAALGDGPLKGSDEEVPEGAHKKAEEDVRATSSSNSGLPPGAVPVEASSKKPTGQGLPPGAVPVYYTHDGIPFVFLGGPSGTSVAPSSDQINELRAASATTPSNYSEKKNSHLESADGEGKSYSKSESDGNFRHVSFSYIEESDTDLQAALRASRMSARLTTSEDEIDRKIEDIELELANLLSQRETRETKAADVLKEKDR